MDEQNGMQVEIGVTEKRYLAQLAKLEAQTLKAANKVEKSWKSSNSSSSRSFASLERGFRKTTGQANVFGGNMRNVSLQLSQVAQQASATGDPLRALAIQLPDLTLGFGVLGIAIGAAAGALLPLAVDFFKSGKGADDLGQTVDELTASIDRYRDALQKSLTPSADMREEYGDLADEAQALFEAQSKLERLDALASLRDAQVGIADQFGSLAGVTEENAVNAAKIIEEFERLDNAVSNAAPGANLTGDLDSAFARLNEVRDQFFEIRKPVERISEELGVTNQAAGEFLASLVRLRDAAPGEEMQAALAAVRENMFAAVDGGAALTEEMEALIRSVLSAEQGMLLFVDAEQDAEAAAGGVKTAIDAIDLSGAISQADLFAVALGGAADQAARAVQLLAVANRSEFQRKLDNANPDFADPRGGVDAPGAGFIPPEILPKLPTTPVATTSSRGSAGGGGGGGGGGGTTSAGLKEMTEAARQALQILEQVNRETVTYADVMAELQAKLDAGKISQDQFNQAMDVAKEKFESAQAETRHLKDELGGMFASALDGADSLSDALEGLLDQLSSFFLNAGGNALGNALAGSLFPSANGNVFSNGRVVPFANGGVVGGPTLFPMRGSQTGLMGEAGPEAILPLTRIGGKLGVRADGGGAAQFTYAPVIDARGSDPSVLERIEQQQRQMAAEFESRVHSTLRTGRNTRRNQVWSGK